MKIISAEFKGSSPDVKKCPKITTPEYAFIGRSNVGKSSLINMLTGRSKLAMTSSTPGKTMLINHFLIQSTSSAGNQSWHLVDLPGYGFAMRGKEGMNKLQNLIAHYVVEREELTCLFVLIDIRLEPQKKDLDFLEFLGENAVPFAIIFTKADKLSKQKIQPTVAAYLKQLSEMWEVLPPHFVTSSSNRLGREDVLSYIEQINIEVKNS